MIMRTNAQQGPTRCHEPAAEQRSDDADDHHCFGAATVNQNDFSVRGLLASLIGAVILLALVNLVRRGRVR